MERDLAVRKVNEALSREYNSLPAYILHSSPWTTERDEPALELLQRLRDVSEKTASWLTTRLREDLGAGPTVRAFEYWKLDLNYLSLPYLLKFSLDHYERVAGEYAATLEEVAADEADEALAVIFRRLKSEAESAHKSIDNFLQGVEDEPEEEEDFEPFPAAAEGAAEEEGEERKVRTFKRPYGKPNYGKEPPKPVKVEPRTKP